MHDKCQDVHTVEPLNNGHFETSFFGFYIEYCSHKEVKLYYHGLVGTTEYVLYREIKSIVTLPFKRDSTV